METGITTVDLDQNLLTYLYVGHLPRGMDIK